MFSLFKANLISSLKGNKVDVIGRASDENNSFKIELNREVIWDRKEMEGMYPNEEDTLRIVTQIKEGMTKN